MACGRPDYRGRVDTNHPGPRACPAGGVPERRRSDQGRHLVGLLRREDGWSIIETLISLPVLVFLLFAGVEYWGVLTVYQHAESLKYHTLARMEVDGGLTDAGKQELIDKLLALGADSNTVVITGSLLGDSQAPVRWPDEVSLRIEFVPQHFDNFVARILLGGQVGQPVRIGVEGSVISQKPPEKSGGGERS